jgi:aspartyl-tRNA(Asn)/glutamyl-tRNA(Gln) amidotransferase subunit C
MSLEKEEIARLAHLARLSIEEHDAAQLSRELGAILAFVEQLNEVDTSALVPLAHPLELTARMRSDEVTEFDQHEKYQSLAPLVESGFYLVPKVVD